MLFQQVNKDDAEKVYIICKNISGATMSAGAAAYFDTADAVDGHAVSGSRTNQEYLFAGIVKSALADDGIGLVQAYGKASAYVLVTGAVAAGDQLNAVDSATHLINYVAIAGSSATIANPWNFVTAMSAVASGISTATLEPVFVRAL